jgi:hypothetical protein
MADGGSELIFAERGRFVGLVSGVEYHVRGSAATGGGGSAGGGSALAAARERGSQRAVRFAEKPQTAPEPWEVAAQAAASTPWDPQPEPAPQQSQRRQPAGRQPQQASAQQRGPPGAFNPSSAEVEAILARTGGPLGGGHSSGARGARGPGSTGPIQMGGGPPGGAYGGASAAPSRQPLPSGPGIDGPGPGGGDIFSVVDFQSPAGAASGAGAETRPRSRGGLCAREGIMPVSRGLRDTPWQAGRATAGGGGGRFDAAATDFEGTHTQTHTQTHATSASRGVLPGT